MERFRTTLRGLGVLCLALPALGQAPRALVLQQQAVPGVGRVTWVDEIEVADDGTWVVEGDTDFPSFVRNGVVLRDGVLVLREGAQVAPFPAAISRFQSVTLARDGALATSNVLINTPTSGDDGGIYLDGTSLLVQEASIPLSSVWTPGTFYVFFRDVILNANRQLLARGYVDDPFVAGCIDDFISVLSFDAAGNLTGETVVAHEFGLWPGSPAPVGSLDLDPAGAGFNSLGQVLFTAHLDFGAVTLGDSTVWLFDGQAYTLLAREGDPAPVAGRAWGSLFYPRLALNDAGDWVIAERLDPSDATNDEVIVKNGAKLVQEGDPLPALGGFRLRGFGLAAPALDDAGEVLWWGRWDDPDASRNHGLFVDGRLLLQAGRVEVDGRLLTTIDDTSGAYAISPNGRWVIFRGRLSDGRRGAFLIDRDDPLRAFCYGADYLTACPCGNSGSGEGGCDNSFATGGARLVPSGVPSLASDTLRLDVSGLPPDAVTVLLEDVFAPPDDGGIPFGDGVLCSGGGFVFLAARYPAAGAVAFGAGAGDAPLSTLGSPGGTGQARFYQAVYRNQRPFCTSERFNFSNGLRVLWQP